MSINRGLNDMLDVALSIPRRDADYDVAISSPEPLASTIVGVILSFSASSILSCFLTHRFLAVKNWWRLPLSSWLVVAIYIDSWIFVFGTAIIDYGIGVDSNLGVCSAAILLCLFCYISTKLIYMFLVEKAFIIRGGTPRRLESKLYLFNTFGVLTVYGILCILCSVYRVARMENDQCIIGIKRQALIPLITFDILVNIYLTVLFLNPLQNIYLGKGLSRWPPNPPNLRAAGIRTFVGALCTTTSSVINLTVLMVLDGELGCVCLMCCNADILFSALIIQWLTSRDNPNTTSNTNTIPSSSASTTDKPSALPSAASSRPRRRRSHRPTISLPLNATSTSQYEHIFGSPDPAQSQERLNLGLSIDTTDVASTSASSSSNAAPNKSAIPNATTLSYFSFDDADLTPAPYNSDEVDVRSNSQMWRDQPVCTDANARRGSAGPSSSSSRTGRERRRRESSATVATTGRGMSTGGKTHVAAAVAADLDRIRRYRQRRPTPSRAAVAVAEEASSESYPYRISHLAFEGDRVGSSGGGDLGVMGSGSGGGSVQWYDFDRLDGEEAGSDVGNGGLVTGTAPAGWI